MPRRTLSVTVTFQRSQLLVASETNPAQLPSQADKNRRALARRRSRLRAAPNCTPASRRLQFAPATALLVAAAAAPLPGGRLGGRFLQLRVSALCGCTDLAGSFCRIPCDLCSSPQP